MNGGDEKRNEVFIKIGSRIQKYRQKANMTQDKLAEKVGTSQKHLSRIELGYHLPNFETVIAIAKELDVPIDAFVEDIEDNRANTFLELIKSDVEKMSDKQLDMLKNQVELIMRYDF